MEGNAAGGASARAQVNERFYTVQGAKMVIELGFMQGIGRSK